MTITVDGVPVILEFVSCNNNMTLWRRSDTKISDGYLHNIYSQFFASKVVFHKKLKIYYNDIHGYYVKAQGIRCYANDLIKGRYYNEAD